MQKFILPSVLLLSVILLGACKDKPAAGPSLESQVATNYSTILEAGYQDSYKAAVAMQTKIEQFLANPTEQGLEDAKKAWLAAREPYMQTEIGRFYDGPIDGEKGDGILNSWPLDEGYIDYLSGASHGYSSSEKDFTTGIVNMPAKFPTINQDILVSNNQPDGGRRLNANGDDIQVSVGYHAIEFLLWGQDNTPAGSKIPGQRSYKDYLTTTDATAPYGDRRALYLKTVTQLAIDNLKELADAWAPGADNYRKNFEANLSAAIGCMFNGVGRLAKGEMSGERMGTPLRVNAQEQEHSCFSDNTHRDLWLNMQGIVNVYYGKYKRIDGSEISGPGLSDYVKSVNRTDEDRMKTLLTEAQARLKEIENNKPFDWLIDGDNSSGNEIVRKGLNAVAAGADWVTQISHDLKLSKVTIPEENP